MSRNYTVYSSSVGIEGGRYSHAIPIQAAKQVAEKLFSSYEISQMKSSI